MAEQLSNQKKSKDSFHTCIYLNFMSFEESELEQEKKDNYSRESVQYLDQIRDLCTIEPLIGNAEH